MGERGLRTDCGLLCVIDGANGLRKAIETVFANKKMYEQENVLTRKCIGKFFWPEFSLEP